MGKSLKHWFNFGCSCSIQLCKSGECLFDQPASPSQPSVMEKRFSSFRSFMYSNRWSRAFGLKPDNRPVCLKGSCRLLLGLNRREMLGRAAWARPHGRRPRLPTSASSSGHASIGCRPVESVDIGPAETTSSTTPGFTPASASSVSAARRRSTSSKLLRAVAVVAGSRGTCLGRGRRGGRYRCRSLGCRLTFPRQGFELGGSRRAVRAKN